MTQCSDCGVSMPCAMLSAHTPHDCAVNRERAVQAAQRLAELRVTQRRLDRATISD